MKSFQDRNKVTKTAQDTEYQARIISNMYNKTYKKVWIIITSNKGLASKVTKLKHIMIGKF